MLQILMIVSYLIITTCVTLYSRRRAQKNTSAFYTANRVMSLPVVTALLFSAIVAGSGTIGNAANAFTGGLSNAIWANWGMAIGCFAVAFTVSKFYYTMADKYGAMTIPSAFSVMMGERVRTIMVFIVALVYVIFYSSQASAAATIIGPLLGIDATIVTWIITALFIIAAISGGMIGASWMSIVHTTVMCIGLAVVAFASVKSVGGLDTVIAAAPDSYFSIIGDKPMTTLANALGTAISFLASSNVTIALFGSRSPKEANRGIITAGALILPFALLPAIIGICAQVLMPGINSGSALFLMANSLGSVFGGLVSMAIIAAIWSTAPGLLLIVSATMTKDFYLSIKPKANEKKQMHFSYAVIIIAGILGTWIGMNGKSILDNMLGAFQIRSIVGIVLLAAIVWPRVNERSAFWSMLTGGITAAVWFFVGKPLGIEPLWAGSAICLIVLIPLTLASRERYSEGYRKYASARGKRLPDEKESPKPVYVTKHSDAE